MNRLNYPVRSRSELVELILALAADVSKNPDSWENRDLPSYLEAMASWIEDMDGYYDNTNQSMPDDRTWAVVADILKAARVYE